MRCTHTHFTPKLKPHFPRSSTPFNQLEMAKRFKLKLSLPSFQLCRPKYPPSDVPPPPPTATYLFSPINPKAFEIAYPANFPDPPPTTPTYINPRSPFSIRHLSATSKVTPLISTSCNSPISYQHISSCSTPPRKQIKGDKTSDDIFVNSTCDFSCSEESESPFSSSGSLDDFSSFSITGGTVKRKSKNVKAARKLKRYASNKFGTTANGGEVGENNHKGSNKSVFRRLMPPCAAEGKVKESFAVVTTSDNPYDDFKRSMLEMILEKQMFEAKDLEELLQCFLTLNSRHHHPVIVAAFTEVWEVLFH